MRLGQHQEERGMKRLITMLLLAAACGPPPVAPEPEPKEYAFVPQCADKLNLGMKIDAVKELCGPPTSALYAPDFRDVTALRYCQKDTPCHQMYLLAFIDGELKFWGRAYEVVQ